jgi:predicted acylesterase/phospholipase RssA
VLQVFSTAARSAIIRQVIKWGTAMRERVYNHRDFDHTPEESCDVIMKGGITSGVVYPWAIAELAKKYRFSSIGGTSAGAIAAAATAAAEYGRHVEGKGFMRLAALPSEIGPKLLSLFQPVPPLRPLFDIFLAVLNAGSAPGKAAAGVWAALRAYARTAALWGLPGIVVVLVALWLKSVGFVFFGVLLALMSVAVGVALALKNTALQGLPANNYGLCPGIRQPDYAGPGFTDWLSNVIDEAAGRDPKNDPPLTFGDLASPTDGRPAIELKMMTTNLMLRRPYSLPFEEDIFKFKRADFEKLFPPRIMEHLLARCARFEQAGAEEGEFYDFPKPADLPVVVAARMSLSFPVLISAVPLYARDFTFATKTERNKLRLCLFSDGGLSSNFPIQFFDNLLPGRPTFGISLDEYDVGRDRLKTPSDAKNPSPSSIRAAPDNEDGESRVWMPSPSRPTGGVLIPIQPFEGLAAFALRLIDAAKDWQDNLQGTLAGYRERIIHIYLKPTEGGININMPKKTTAALSEYGARAGEELRDKFDLNEHRWRRFLVAMDRMQTTLAAFAKAHAGETAGPQSYAEFLTAYPAKPPEKKPPLSYSQKPGDLEILRRRAADLAALADEWAKQPTIPEMPRPPSDLRITPKP